MSQTPEIASTMISLINGRRTLIRPQGHCRESPGPASGRLGWVSLRDQDRYPARFAAAISLPLDVGYIPGFEWRKVRKAELKQVVDEDVGEYTAIAQRRAHDPIAHATLDESLDLLADLP